MAGDSSFVALDAQADAALHADAVTPEVETVEAPAWVDADWEDAAPAPGSAMWRDWLFPVAAFLAVMAWTNLFVWANYDAITSRPSAAQALGWVSAWSGPVMLIAVVLLLAMRGSRREAARFGEAARGLAAEAQALEARLAAVNGELGMAREFLTAQARDLDSLGRAAGDRLGQHADRLASLIHGNSAQVEAIGSVSAAALENMETLRGQLPMIATMGRDVTNAIGNAGRVAQGHLQDMVAGFERLNQFGQASERQVESLRQRIDTALSQAETVIARIDTGTSARFAAISERSDAFTAALDRHEEQAQNALRARAEALTREIETARGVLDEAEAERLAALQTRLAVLDRDTERLAAEHAAREQMARTGAEAAMARLAEQTAASDAEIARRHAAQGNAITALAARNASTLAELAAMETRLGALLTTVEAGELGVLQRLDLLERRLADSRRGIDATDGALTGLTDASVRLLELIQASVQHSAERLPLAIGAGEDRLSALETRAIALREVVGEAGERGDALAAHVLATRAELAGAMVELGTMQAGLESGAHTHHQLLDATQAQLAALSQDSNQLAGQAQGALRAAIAQLAAATDDAVGMVETRGAAGIASFADRLRTETGTAIDDAMAGRAEEIGGQLEAAATHAAEVSRDAAVQLRDQLAKVIDLTSNLERRVAHARERAEEQVDNDFSRRVALITESLNSHAIDVAKALDSEVSDTAWAAYLRGDRGIFTRRAVRLLDTGEARAIAQVYDADPSFREVVSRYIHDFEAMLRQLLATRDGHALGVTLLSSDMGKLYVALAQAIERLRN